MKEPAREGARKAKAKTGAKLDDIDVVLLFLEDHAQDYRTAIGFSVMRYRPRRGIWMESKIDDVSHDLQRFIKTKQIEAVRTLQGDEAVERVKSWVSAANRVRRISQLFLDRREHRVDVDDFDASPDHLCVRNGVVDLRTGTLVPHGPEHMMTRRARVEYVETAECPEFLAVLERALPDPEVREFLHRALGYSCTGYTSEEKMVIHHGSGANSKSTVLGAVRWVLGDYAASVSSSLISQTREDPERATPELRGARFGEIQESASSRRMDEELVKRITSGEPLRANPKNLKPYTFSPVVKLMLATNALPQIHETTDAIWRRLAVVPWTVQIPEEERDPKLKRRLIHDEGPGILRWLVAGAQRWYAEGLGIPPGVIVEETRTYRHDEDVVGAFVEDCFEPHHEVLTTTSEMWEVAQYWQRENGVRLPIRGQRGLTKELVSKRGVFPPGQKGTLRALYCVKTDTANGLLVKYRGNSSDDERYR